MYVRVFKIAGVLGLIYSCCFALLAAVGLANHRTESLLSAGRVLILFMKNVLGFPLNLINRDYPFLMDSTGKMIDAPVHPLLIIAINFSLQVLLILLIGNQLRRRREKS